MASHAQSRVVASIESTLGDTEVLSAGMSCSLKNVLLPANDQIGPTRPLEPLLDHAQTSQGPTSDQLQSLGNPSGSSSIRLVGVPPALLLRILLSWRSVPFICEAIISQECLCEKADLHAFSDDDYGSLWQCSMALYRAMQLSLATNCMHDLYNMVLHDVTQCYSM